MILFLYGPDTYRSQQKAVAIIDQYRKVYPGAMGERIIDCATSQAGVFQHEIEATSLFERKKLMVLKDLFLNSEFVRAFDEKKKILESSDRHIVLLLSRAEIKEKTKNKLYQWLKKNAKCQEFSFLPPAKVVLWVQGEFQKYGVVCATRPAETLARLGGNDLWALSGEVSKIAAFLAGQKRSSVKEADILLLVSAQLHVDVFATVEHIARGNKKEALELLYRHLKKGDSPHYLFSMVQYQFRVLLELRDMMDRGLSVPQIVAKSKLHPYVVKKGMAAAHKFSLRQLLTLYASFFELDLGSKTGKKDIEASFDLLLAKM